MSRGALLQWAACGLCVVLASCARGPQRDTAAKPSYVVRAWSFQRLREAEGQLAATDYAGAAATLERMEARRGLNDHERALMLQLRAHLFAAQRRYADALESLKACLALDALPPEDTRKARYNLAQLYLANERYADAADVLEGWLSELPEPPADALFLTATSLIRAERRARALPYLERAIAARAEDAPEAWLRLMANVLIEQGQHAAAEPWLKRLLERSARKDDWLRLHLVYEATDRPARALAVLQLMDRQGMLSSQAELLSLAQRYLAAQLPARAADVLRRGLESEAITETAEHLQLLAGALSQARALDEAAQVMLRAAALSDSGDLYVAAARLLMDQERFEEAAKAVRAAFKKGALTSPGEAYLLLGIARFRAGAPGSARQAFRQARQMAATRQPATLWLKHLDAAR